MDFCNDKDNISPIYNNYSYYYRYNIFLSLDKSSQKTEISNKNIEILEQEINDMSIQTSELDEKIIEANTDKFKEKVIRNELLLQKPGEIIIQLSSAESQKINFESSQVEVEKPLDSWLDLIF